MAEKELLQQHLGSMRRQLTSLDDLCDAARNCLARTQSTYSEAVANAQAHGQALSEVDNQRYAGLLKEAQDNVAIAVSAREQFHAKLHQLEDRISRL